MDTTETALVRSGRSHPAQPDGGIEGYRAKRTLPVRVEFARQLRRRRTRLTLGFLVVLPVLLLLSFEIGDAVGRGRTFADMATESGLNFTAFTLFASTGFLLVVVVALFFGDTVASEASWSSLKYLLAAPVPRVRLLRQKAIVAGLLSIFGLVLLTAISLGVGVLWYGAGNMVTTTGESVPFGSGLASLAAATAYLAVHLTWIAGLALWLSVSTDAPLGAVGGAVVVSILSEILDQINALGSLRTYLPTHYSTAYADLLGADVDWTEVTRGAFSALTYATLFTALAIWRFQRKDITS
ncbi:ABC transporter permease [Saccharopolyspora sp. WRP15-2]|uniref:ABC transporter permease n=1 Tax=Saccharopolyspora oryzae TaxID=2997343 RepID=A0ABT4V5N7_9PSEU|nr:ABC transporter permease [Saccharopolyspora oryzae]MDA3628719.1 ABC transporter permease [Saccharopolyspora oryzae]